ncbi:UNVERIFIED_CONTAM: hypothetical protein GTU68_020444 [Idotea baltica]|nr:hypothetical protein [Idotea baltica]
MRIFDTYDRAILQTLQNDADISIEHLSDQIGLSRNATWRRVKRLEEDKVIRGRVALLNPDSLGLGLVVFISVRTDQHDAGWADTFTKALRQFPEIVGAYRTSGDLDYLLHARVSDVKAYDALYQRLIAKIDLKDVSASFVMEELKETTALPLP